MSFILYQSCTRQVNKSLVLLEVLGQTMFAGYMVLGCVIRWAISVFAFALVCKVEGCVDCPAGNPGTCKQCKEGSFYTSRACSCEYCHINERKRSTLARWR